MCLIDSMFKPFPNDDRTCVLWLFAAAKRPQLTPQRISTNSKIVSVVLACLSSQREGLDALTRKTHQRAGLGMKKKLRIMNNVLLSLSYIVESSHENLFWGRTKKTWL